MKEECIIKSAFCYKRSVLMFCCEKITINEIICINHLKDECPGNHAIYPTDSMYYYQLLYKLDGKTMVTFNGKTMCEKQNDIRFLPNPSLFDYPPDYCVDFCEQGECINIAFTSNSRLPDELLVKNYSSNPELKLLFKKIQKIWYYKHYGWYVKCMSVLYDIIYKILKNETEYLASKTNTIIMPAIDYIDANFTKENIDCGYLAKLCNVSYAYMSKLFVKRFGVTPNKYIVMKKIDFACDLLKSQCYTIGKTSDMCGFVNTYYFSRVFKNIVGIPPSQYAQKFRPEF